MNFIAGFSFAAATGLKTGTQLEALIKSATFAPNSGALDQVTLEDDGAGKARIKNNSIGEDQLVTDFVDLIPANAVVKSQLEKASDMVALGNTSGAEADIAEVAISNDTDLTDDSETELVTEHAVKTYADAVGVAAEEYADTVGVAANEHTDAAIAATPSMVYSGATIFTGVQPTSAYADLDLSSIVGTNRCFVHLALYAGVSTSNASFITKGDSPLARVATNAGWGTSGGVSVPGKVVYVSLVTNADGVVEWLGGAGSSGTVIKILTYQVLP